MTGWSMAAEELEATGANPIPWAVGASGMLIVLAGIVWLAGRRRPRRR